MGQYYYVVCPDRREYLHPHRFGEGLKLMEFAVGRGTVMAALALLLADGNGRGLGDAANDGGSPLVGSWAGRRVVVAGDYADMGGHLPDGWEGLPYVRDDDHDEDRRGLTVGRVWAADQAELVRSSQDRGEEFTPDRKPNLYWLAGRCFRDISLEMVEVLRREPGSPYATTDENFVESTDWVRDGVARPERRDLTYLKSEDVGRVAYFAGQKGDAYLSSYAAWLLRQDLLPRTRAIIDELRGRTDERPVLGVER